MEYFAENVKYLMWVVSRSKRPSGQAHDSFFASVSTGCAISPERMRDILSLKADASEDEIARIKRFFMKYDEDRVPYFECEPFYRKEIAAHKSELILDNIMFLIRAIPWGDNQDFIRALQIRASTLTRWKSGKMKPSRHFQREICRYYGLGDADELQNAYLFFGLSPVTTPQRKLECKRLIDALEPKAFEAVYPALLKLLN